MAVTKVWLDERSEDCTMCGLCATICPAVFEVPEKMKVLPDADLSLKDEIEEAATSCPVDVIAIEHDNSGNRDNVK